MSDNNARPKDDVDEPLERVLEEFDAREGVTANRISRKGFEKRQERIRVFAERTNRFASLDGGQPNEVTKRTRLAEMPANVSYEVLVALAEVHGYRLEEK